MDATVMRGVEQQTELLWTLVLWIDERTDGFVIEATERHTLAAGCFNVAIEHQAAVAQLCQLKRYASAFALLRSVFEALVRGMWIHHCASENDLKKFQLGKLNKKMRELVAEVEASIEDYEDQVLSRVLQSAWTSLNGFTHTGINMVSRQFAPGRLEAVFEDGEIVNAVGFAGALGLIAALQLFQLSERKDAEVLAAFMEKMTEYASQR